MSKLICNSVDNRKTDKCTACGKPHYEYVHACVSCRYLNVVRYNMPHTCGRCGKDIDTETGHE